MRYAFLSDVHGHADLLQHALALLQQDAIDRVVTLGDIGSDDCFDLLRAARAVGVFGNWEVSGYARLAPPNRALVLEQRPVLAEDDFLAAHAMPSYPAGLFNVVDFADYMHRTGTSWRALFRYPDEGYDHLWTIFAELQARTKSVFFHGHTHRQVAWRIAPSDRPREVRAPIVVVEPAAYYIVGVGSLGRPDDGPAPRYVIYDSTRNEIELRTLTCPES